MPATYAIQADDIISIAVSSAMKSRLIRLAEQRDQSLSAVTRRLIERGLPQIEAETQAEYGT